MKTKGVILGALLCLVGLTSVARADDRKEIDALYRRLEKAMTNKDMKGIMACGTKDFSETENGRTITADQMTAMMQQQFSMIKGPMKTSFKIVSCQIKGKTANIVSSDTSSMTIAGQDGKAHQVTSVGKSKDTVVKTPKGWLVKSVLVVTNKMTMDGKPFDPNKPQGGAK